MAEELLGKVRNNVVVTDGKKYGHGIGLTQVHDTINANYGKFTIYSTVGIGTKIVLKFPKFISPGWIADKIDLIETNIIIILDDDPSIHGAWDSKFEGLLKEEKELKIHHFTAGIDAINFVNSLIYEDRERVFFLTDFELLKQEYNGLEVLRHVGIMRAILVTSHYANIQIRKLATTAGIKILPKNLAYIVPININRDYELKKVDMIFVDDERIFIDSLISYMFNDLTIDTYDNPLQFLENINKYSLDTKIILDNYYYTEDDVYDIDGLTIAKKLHDKGFINLYMLSGEMVGNIPDYLTVILKSDHEKIKSLAYGENKFS